MTPRQPVPLPADEKVRLEELYRLGILDTAAEERFDRFTQCVADIFEVPTAFISFIDRNRQWVKSCCGIPFTGSERDVAFCSYTILHPELLVIPDATRDPRFADNPLVLEQPHIRFYAGAVLRGPRGHALGTLCLIDTAPREMSDRERNRLLTVARMLEQELLYEFRFQEIRKQAYHDAHYDSKTGLPNANLFLDRVSQTIPLARGSSIGLLVAIMELRTLPDVLSVVGKHLGDNLLRACAERLTTKLSSACTVARWRGDHFALLLPNLKHPEEAMTFSHLLGDAFKEPVQVDSRAFQLDVICGAAIYPDSGLDAETLMASAQTALRQSQQAPHAPCRLHTLEIGRAMSRRLHLEENLREALANHSLSVVYQPIVTISTGIIHAVEVLSRWEGASLGVIPTEEFIRLAEQAGLIMAVDEQAITRAARQLRLWDELGYDRLSMAVNISGKTLLQENFPVWLQAVLEPSGLPPSRVILEITENHLLNDIDLARRNIASGRKSGFRFAIDDFGAGFSSFDYLTKLSVDEIKIDRTFTKEMTERTVDASIAHALINMARDLGIPPVAEGVETYEQVLYLKAYQCKDAQGYYFGRPVSPENLNPALKRQAG